MVENFKTNCFHENTILREYIEKLQFNAQLNNNTTKSFWILYQSIYIDAIVKECGNLLISELKWAEIKENRKWKNQHETTKIGKDFQYTLPFSSPRHQYLTNDTD